WNFGHTVLSDPGWIMPVTILISLLGIFIAWLIYGKEKISREMAKNNALYQLFYNKYYVDELYDRSIVRGTTGISYFVWYVEKYIVEVAIGIVVTIVDAIGRLHARLQNGQVQTYGAVA